MSVSELIRERCLNIPANDEDEFVLETLVEQVNELTKKTKKSLNKSLNEVIVKD